MHSKNLLAFSMSPIQNLTKFIINSYALRTDFINTVFCLLIFAMLFFTVTNQEQRYLISALLKQGTKKFTSVIGKHKSTL